MGELSRAGRRRKGLAAGAPMTMRRFAILYEQAGLTTSDNCLLLASEANEER